MYESNLQHDYIGGGGGGYPLYRVGCLTKICSVSFGELADFFCLIARFSSFLFFFFGGVGGGVVGDGVGRVLLGQHDLINCDLCLIATAWFIPFLSTHIVPYLLE